jgi:hypothetical protein
MALWVTPTVAFSTETPEGNLSSSPTPTNRSISWGRPSNIIDIGLGYLFSTSNSSWGISFPDRNGRSRSVLEFKGITSGMPIVFLDINHPQSCASLSLQFGKGQGFNGEGTDSDYLPSSRQFRSQFDLSEETAFWIADIQTTFAFASKPRWVLKPFIGWEHFEENITMTNGRWMIVNGQEAFSSIAGLDSRYNFNWNAFRLGAKGEMELGASQPGIIPFRLKTHLAIFPYMHYTGFGVWNLRNDLKKDPSFSHEVDKFGLLGIDGAISLAYQPLKFLEIEGGARLSYFYVQDGTDTAYFSDNTVAEANLDEAKALQIGFFVKITGRF